MHVHNQFAQKEGIDYNEIFFSCNQAYIYSDVIGDSSFDLELEQMDVKTVRFFHDQGQIQPMYV